jgi:shikimate kinase
MHRLTLIGFRACGKSTVGRLLAARLAWPFVDADTVIEHAIGTSISSYFAAHGEAAFRSLESTTLAGILACDGPLVLATGGGAVLAESNRQLLAARGGLVVYLEAPVAVIQERLRHNLGGRPSLTGSHPVDEVPALIAARAPLYRALAKLVLPTSSTPGEVAGELLGELARRGLA